MAVEEEGLRVFQSVRIKIGEAKNLPTYPGPNKMRDCYCTVNLDQEEVFRTKIVEKSLCPFYGEDFYCEIPRSFRHLSFYIFDRDVFRRDSIIGKVAILKEDLQKYHNRDTWFQLQHVDADSEVQKLNVMKKTLQKGLCAPVNCELIKAVLSNLQSTIPTTLYNLERITAFLKGDVY